MPSYPEIFIGPPRSYRRTSSGAPVTSAKRYITIHNTANTASAEGEAAYAKTRTDGTSSHYYCDSDSLIQSLNTDWCAGHVGSLEGNTYGICYEITGVNGWTRAQWLANVAWDLLAKQIAIDCKQFGIPARRLTVAEMKTKQQTGFITHNDARLAWGGTTHTDPGPGFPMDYLLALVGAVLNGDDMSYDRMTAWRVGGYLQGQDPIVVPLTDGAGSAAESTLPNKPKQQMDRIESDVKAIKAAQSAPVPVHLSDGDRIAIADMVAAQLKPAIEALPKPPTAAELEAASDRAVRKALGQLDGATPAAGS